MVRIDWNPTPGKLRSFGLVVIAGFGLLGAAFWLGKPFAENRTAAVALWAAGGLLGLPGLTGTKAGLPGYLAWMAVAFAIGSVTGRVMLALFYYTMITFTGLVMRATGRDRLNLKRRQTGTYWTDLRHNTDPPGYERQF